MKSANSHLDAIIDDAHLILQRSKAMLHHLHLLHVLRGPHGSQHAFLLIDQLLRRVNVREQFVKVQRVQQTLFAHLGQPDQLIVPMGDIVEPFPHFRRITVLIAQTIGLLLQTPNRWLVPVQTVQNVLVFLQQRLHVSFIPPENKQTQNQSINQSINQSTNE